MRLVIVLTLLATSVFVARAFPDVNNQKELEGPLKTEDNEVDSGSEDQKKNGEDQKVLGHRSEQEWIYGPKKQRKSSFASRGKPKKVKNDLDDPRLQDLEYSPKSTQGEEEGSINSVDRLFDHEHDRLLAKKGRKQRKKAIRKKAKESWVQEWRLMRKELPKEERKAAKKSMKKEAFKETKNQERKAEKRLMIKALKKGISPEKVFESMTKDGKFSKKFYKKFLSKYEQRQKKGKKSDEGEEKEETSLPIEP